MKSWQKKKSLRNKIKQFEKKRLLLQEQIDILDEKIVMTSIQLAEFDLKDRIEKTISVDKEGE